MAWRGVSKSGSPMVSWMTSAPAARSSRALTVMATVAATRTRLRRWASAGMILAEAAAEILNPGAGLAQAFGVGGVADAEKARVHEGGAVHRGHALFLQQRD